MCPISVRDIGRRVVLRRRLDAGARTVTDVLGVLERFDEDEVAVRRRDGSVVQVERALVVAVKVVPPRPVPRREMRFLEQAAAAGWQAVEQEHLGEWLLRAAGGFTKRANSVLPLGDPLLPPGEAVATLVRWYGARGLPPLVQVPLPVAAAVDAVLEKAGWSALSPTLVLSAPIERLLESAPSATVGEMVLQPQPSAAWLSAYGAEGLTAYGRRVLAEAAEADLCFASIKGGAEVLAIARAAVSGDSGGRRWVGVTGLRVVPQARRQGLATGLMVALSRWARTHDADEAYVQVLESNQAALSLYDGLGFVEHHRYHYRRHPDQPLLSGSA